MDWDEYVGGAFAQVPIALTVGVFDGLHLGHRALVGQILGRSGLSSLVLTFRENPKRILSPRTHGGELSSLGQKLELIESMGADFCALIDFSGDFSKLAGRRFLSILRDRGGMRFLAVGANFRCGRDLDVGVAEIGAFCEGSSVGFEVVPAVRWAGHPVSSSRVRKAVAEGRIEDANAMLGRPYEIDLRDSPQAEGAGAWCRSQVKPPAGAYEAELLSVGGREVSPVMARFDADGRWSVAAVQGSWPKGASEPPPVGLRLLKSVSRE